MDERFEEKIPGIRGDTGERMHRAGSEVKSKGEDLASQVSAEARQRAREMAERNRSGVAQTLGRVGEALQGVANDLQQQQPTTSRLIGEAASGMESLARQISERPLEEMMQRAQETARRQPMLLVAGAAVAGMALTRLMKATAQRDQPEVPEISGEQRRGEEAGGTGAKDISSSPAVGPLPTYAEPVQPARPAQPKSEEERHGTD